MTLHHVMLRFFDRLKAMDKGIFEGGPIDRLVSLFEKSGTQQKSLSAYLASKNSAYFKQL